MALFISGYVTMIMGFNTQIELYSPSGKCNQIIANPPISTMYTPVLLYSNGNIILCYPVSFCWKYIPEQSFWEILTNTSNYTHYQPGVAYQGRVYLFNDPDLGQLYDPVSNIWSTWPLPLIQTGLSPCMLIWRDSVLLLGGSMNIYGVQMFNFTTQNWTVYPNTNELISMVRSSCLVLEDDVVLIVGTDISPNNISALYNPITNSWSSISWPLGNSYGTRLTKLGNRAFSMGNKVVSEFILSNQTWLQMEIDLINDAGGHQSVLDLSDEIFHFLPNGCEGV